MLDIVMTECYYQALTVGLSHEAERLGRSVEVRKAKKRLELAMASTGSPAARPHIKTPTTRFLGRPAR